VRLPDAPDANASTNVVLPSDAAWFFASFSPVFDSGAGAWRTPLAGPLCTQTPLGAAWAQNATPIPPLPAVALAYDGASIAAHARALRQLHARWIALALAGLGLAMLIAMILTASFRGDPAALRSVSASAKQRLWIALLGTFALLVGGFVLLYTFALRT
jgi:hypothetical protein